MILLTLFLLTGCFGNSSKPEKPPIDPESRQENKLEVETLLSQTIFLRPVLHGERSVYLRFNSTSDKPVDLTGLQKELATRLMAKGYRITSPEKANFLLQINILSISKSSKPLTKDAVANGFGAAVAIAGAAAGPAGSVVGTATQSATNLLFRDTYYNMTTDIKLSERPVRINILKAETHANAMPDAWQEHQTKAISSAKDVNANQEQVIDMLEENLLSVLNGLL
jgi:hypothetical protein